MKEVRAVGAEAFEDVYPLLRQFPTTQMSKDDWYRMLFAMPWSDSPQRGYALYAEGKSVGFIATIFRTFHARDQCLILCSRWIASRMSSNCSK